MGKPNNNDGKEKGNKNFWSEFLDLYKANSVLWDIKHKGYYNQKLRNNAKVILANKLKEIYPRADTIMVRQRINSFRTSYRQQKLKVDASKHSGASSDEVYKPTLWFYNKLSFLDGSNNTLTVSTTPLNNCKEDYEPVKKKQKKLSDSDDFITLAKERLSKQPTCNDSIAKYWSKACNDMDNDQRIIAERQIADIIYKGLNRKLINLPDENKITDSAAKFWSQTCNNMDNDQRIIAQRQIADILFKGENRMLNVPMSEEVTVFRGNSQLKIEKNSTFNSSFIPFDN